VADDPKMTNRTIAVLAELLQDPSSPRYGLEISEKAEIKTTTIYDILMRLEQAGWVKSRWESVAPNKVGRPRRRLYSLTGMGEAAARAAIEREIQKLQRTVDATKGRIKPLPSRPSTAAVSR
jgi:DNA-binding PadR family transcriptional regulator